MAATKPLLTAFSYFSYLLDYHRDSCQE
uniref:Uncharacterized protein n=1 Tax=Arundo donax TaxID=35708 RepID=A0A0A9BJU6_ARUDO